MEGKKLRKLSAVAVVITIVYLAVPIALALSSASATESPTDECVEFERGNEWTRVFVSQSRTQEFELFVTPPEPGKYNVFAEIQNPNCSQDNGWLNFNNSSISASTRVDFQNPGDRIQLQIGIVETVEEWQKVPVRLEAVADNSMSIVVILKVGPVIPPTTTTTTTTTTVPETTISPTTSTTTIPPTTITETVPVEISVPVVIEKSPPAVPVDGTPTFTG